MKVLGIESDLKMKKELDVKMVTYTVSFSC